MAVLLIMAIILTISVPLLQKQMAIRYLESIAKQFVMQVNFARNQALYLGQSVRMVPHDGRDWSDGWIITSGCSDRHIKAACQPKPWLSQGEIFPLYFKNPGFSDPHSQQKGIQFNAAGAAKTGQGGFVANRLILGHRHYSDLERQLILGSGGRWRICNPEADRKACK